MEKKYVGKYQFSHFYLKAMNSTLYLFLIFSFPNDCRYLSHVHKCILQDTEYELPEELSDDYLNVRFGMRPFSRKSHEKTKRLLVSNGKV